MPFALFTPFTKKARNAPDNVRILEELSADLRRLVRATEYLAAATVASAMLAAPKLSAQNETSPEERVKHLIASARAMMKVAGDVDDTDGTRRESRSAH